MRILHIDTGPHLRGGQWQVLYLLEGLVSCGHECTLLAPVASRLYEAAVEKGWDVRPLGLASVARLSRRADLTHAHDARAHTLAALAARGPRVVARRVAFPVQRNPLSRWKYARAAHFIAVSKYVADKLRAAGIGADRISVVYDGVPLRPAAGGGTWIVAPRTTDPRKGTALLKQAAALAGLDVRFSCSLTEDLPGAAAFVYITQEEGLGSGVLLAMAAGVPVVASRAGGLVEIVEDGRTGFAVENTPESIAAALRRVLQDRPLALRVAEAGRRQVEERFSVETMVRKTMQVYERVLAC